MGRQIHPKNVVGRDRLIQDIWNHLGKAEGQNSLRFTAERRIGKTTVMSKMKAEPADGFDVLFLDVEGIDSCDELTEKLLNHMKPFLKPKEWVRKGFRGIWKTLEGIEIRGQVSEIGGQVKLPKKSVLSWQQKLEKVIEDFCNHRPNRTILLIFDELPYMLQKIDQVSTKAGKAHEALTLLDTFRALRQRHSNLRMIYAGSVGLHHVLRDLKKKGLPSQPYNDMWQIDIPPLTDDDALILANRLLGENRIRIDAGGQAIARRVTEQTSNVPFYMERIANMLALIDGPVTLEDVDRTVQNHLTSDHDHWEMEHFRSRLKDYYGGTIERTDGKRIPEAEIARSILDHFALAEEPQSIEQVWSIIRSQYALTDRMIVLELLKSLAQDHYLEDKTLGESRKRYSFRFPLIKRWWVIAQGLNS
jgi:hypothetical protein